MLKENSLTLKYNKKERVITGLKRISKPGLRVTLDRVLKFQEY